MDSSKGPNRVNRAHWPTKENRNILNCFGFFGPWKKWPGMAPNGARRIFVPTNPDLADVFGKRICILTFFFDCLDFKLLDFQVPRSPNSWISRSPDLQIPRFPGFQTASAVAAGAAGRILRSQPDPSPNAPRDQIRRNLRTLAAICPRRKIGQAQKTDLVSP